MARLKEAWPRTEPRSNRAPRPVWCGHLKSVVSDDISAIVWIVENGLIVKIVIWRPMESVIWLEAAYRSRTERS